MTNSERAELLKYKLDLLLNFGEINTEEDLSFFNDIKKEILDLLEDNPKARFNQIKFYEITYPKLNALKVSFQSMNIILLSKGFEQANALISDTIFSLVPDKNSPEYLRNFKLLRARHANPDFEVELAGFICGDACGNFPERTFSSLKDFFTALGFNLVNPDLWKGTSVKNVAEVLLERNIMEISFIIEKGLFNKVYFKREHPNYEKKYQRAGMEFKKFIDESLSMSCGLDLSYLLDLNINTELLFDKIIETSDKELNKLIKEAKDRFFNPKDKQIAVEKLWDAFERMKTYYSDDKKTSAQNLVSIISEKFDYDFLNSEFEALTDLGNTFRIRHHETEKKTITESKHLNYLFFRMLSLLDLCLTGIHEHK